jgi:hypothetical protein
MSDSRTESGGHADDCPRDENEWTKPYILGDGQMVWVCDECEHAMVVNRDG